MRIIIWNPGIILIGRNGIYIGRQSAFGVVPWLLIGSGKTAIHRAEFGGFFDPWVS